MFPDAEGIAVPLRAAGGGVMLATSFPIVMPHLLAHEGGYVNHPRDPGGHTKYGITLATYRRWVNPMAGPEDIKRLTPEGAKPIYRERYWSAVRCDELPAGVDYAVFDYGVNSGVGRAGKVLRRVCGLKDDATWPDTLSAVRRRDAKALVAAIQDERLRFLRSLKTWDAFGAGWERRVREVRAVALSMAASPQAAPVPSPAPGKGEVAPAPTGAVVKGGGVVTTTATGSGLAWGWLQSPEVVAALVIGGIVVTLVAVVLLHRLRKRRQEAVVPFNVVPEAA